jgi:hypothetical protein
MKGYLFKGWKACMWSEKGSFNWQTNKSSMGGGPPFKYKGKKTLGCCTYNKVIRMRQTKYLNIKWVHIN